MSRFQRFSLWVISVAVPVTSLAANSCVASATERSSGGRVTYTGFTSQAEAAFQRAVDTWSTLISSCVPITIAAKFSPLGTIVLGQAGPSHHHANFSGAPPQNTYYPEALASKLAGILLDPGLDIVASFSSDFPSWYFGIGAAPTSECDFASAVLHELGHSLGCVGGADVRGGLGTIGTPGAPINFDRFSTTGSGQALLSFPDQSATLARALQGGDLFFDSAAVRRAKGGRAAKLDAPTTLDNSGYNHLDEDTAGGRPQRARDARAAVRRYDPRPWADRCRRSRHDRLVTRMLHVSTGIDRQMGSGSP